MRETMKRRACAALALVGVLAAVFGVAGCRSQAPMLQPVAPVPTISTDGAAG